MEHQYYTCRVCNTKDLHPTFSAREMMFGTKELFEYFQCTRCQCLQISHIPSDLSKYYPNNYYSLNPADVNNENFFIKLILKQRFRTALFNKGYKINRLLSYLIKMPEFIIDYKHNIVRLLKHSNIKNYDARFLDVGCGHWSAWLYALSIMGFKYLYGIDPYINKDVKSNRINILKKEIIDFTGEFDLITMHHSLEHIPDQQSTMLSAARLLSKNGTLIIRLPTVSSYVWKKYKTNWVEMDPPRHLYLHSKMSLELLADKAGLEIFDIIPESIDFEFYGSEQYIRDIPLNDNRSYWLTRKNTIFSEDDLINFKRKADDVNKNNEAGRICLFLRKK